MKPSNPDVYSRPAPLTGKETYNELLKRPEWAAYRQMVMDIMGRQCAKCGTAKRLQVHHINYHDGLLPWKYTDPDDIAVLCEACHAKEHGLDPRFTAGSFRKVGTIIRDMGQ